jgi:hypothetical protein
MPGITWYDVLGVLPRAELPPGVGVVRTGRPAQVPATIVRLIPAGCMAGWQITLIALAPPWPGAAATLLLTRARTAHPAQVPATRA